MRAHDGLATTSACEGAEATEDSWRSAIARMLGLAVLTLKRPAAGEHGADLAADEAIPQPSIRQQRVLIGIEEEFFAEIRADAGWERDALTQAAVDRKDAQ